MEIKAELELVNDRQDSCANKLQLLTALRNCALQNPNRAGRVSNLDARIEKLKKSYCLYEKKLYKLKGERAVGEAMADHYAAKLNPKLKYTDIYSVKNSYYLSPIPEENEVDLQEFVSGDFPGENNSSLAATTLRNSQLFLDVSSPSDFIH